MSHSNQNLKQRLTQALDTFFELGFAITPLLGNKAPYRNNWQHEEPLSKYVLIREINSGRSLGLGIRTGPVSGGIVAVDLDGASATPKILELSGNRDLPRTVAFTSGRIGRCQYIYRVPSQYRGSIQTKKIKTGVVGSDGKSEQVELRWDGCQSVLPPSVHPMTGEYKWVEGCAPSECEIAIAPLWLIELMLEYPSATQAKSQPQIPILAASPISSYKQIERWTNIDWALSYLQALAPNRADDYDEWLAVGMALHSVDDSLLSEWDAWSQQSSKYKPGVCEIKWKSFKRTGVSIGSLAHMAKSDGWTKPLEKQKSTSVKQHRPGSAKSSCVTGDSSNNGDTPNPDSALFSNTVTLVSAILERGLSYWEEYAHLDELQSKSGISRASFWELVASLRCQLDEVTPTDSQQLSQLIDWTHATLDFNQVLPHIASDLLHDAQVLNIDPIMLWQYLLPATLSLLGKKVNLCVGSHQIPAIAWTCIVGESGIGKSRAEGVILAPLKAWQKAEYDRFKPEWNKYKSSLNKKTEASSANQPPLPERKFLFGIATIQAVMRRLSEQGQNGSLWARDEIAGLFKSFGQFTAKGESEGLECLLAMWDGAPAPVDRVQQDDSYLVDSTRLSLAGGLQPGVFRKIFSDPDDAQGIQARFLFALPKELPAKRVSGYCHLSDKLPQFYRWVDTQFPGGNIKLSPSADARYSQVYESIGRQVLTASTPAVRAWMRKLPGQLLRIALALHIIECFHEPLRPKLQLQADTLDRAFEICRYYRSTFEVVQESVSDSDCVSSILLKIWDMAATSPQGLAVRDAYRSIKALSRRAKEQGRNVAAYTTDLYYQLEKMGKGSVQKVGRLVRFVVGGTNPPPTQDLRSDPKNPPDSPDDDTPGVTLVTVDETLDTHNLEVSPPSLVSPVTLQDFGQVKKAAIDVGETHSLPIELEHTPQMENLIASFHPSLEHGDKKHYFGQASYPDPDPKVEKTQNKPRDTATKKWAEPSHPELSDTSKNIQHKVPPIFSSSAPQTQFFQALPPDESANVLGGEICKEVDPNASDRIRWGDEMHLCSQPQLKSWLDRIASVQSADECIDFLDALNQLPPDVNELILSNAKNLLPRFWEILAQEQGLAGSSFNSKVSTVQQQPDLIEERITNPPGYEKTLQNAKSYVKNLIAGLWVRTRDGFYGNLAAMQPDGRWWVKSPKSKTRDAESRLYAAADIIPMHSS